MESKESWEAAQCPRVPRLQRCKKETALREKCMAKVTQEEVGLGIQPHVNPVASKNLRIGTKEEG